MIKYVNVCLDPKTFMEQLTQPDDSVEKDNAIQQAIKNSPEMTRKTWILYTVSVCFELTMFIMLFTGCASTLAGNIILFICLIGILISGYMMGSPNKHQETVKTSKAVNKWLQEIAQENLPFEDAVKDSRFAKINNVTTMLHLIYSTNIVSIEQDSTDWHSVTVTAEAEGNRSEYSIHNCLVHCDDCNTLSVTKDAIFLARYDAVLDNSIKSIVIAGKEESNEQRDFMEIRRKAVAKLYRQD